MTVDHVVGTRRAEPLRTKGPIGEAIAPARGTVSRIAVNVRPAPGCGHLLGAVDLVVQGRDPVVGPKEALYFRPGKVQGAVLTGHQVENAVDIGQLLVIAHVLDRGSCEVAPVLRLHVPPKRCHSRFIAINTHHLHRSGEGQLVDQRAILDSDHEDIAAITWQDLHQVLADLGRFRGRRRRGGADLRSRMALTGKGIDATALGAHEETACCRRQAPGGTIDLGFPDFLSRLVKTSDRSTAPGVGHPAGHHRGVRIALDRNRRGEGLRLLLAVLGDRCEGSATWGAARRGNHLAVTFGQVSLRTDAHWFLGENSSGANVDRALPAAFRGKQPCAEVCCVILHQDAGAHGPEADQSPISRQAFVACRGRTGLPSECSALGIETIDCPVVASEQDGVFHHRGSKSNGPSRDETPLLLASGRIETAQRIIRRRSIEEASI